MIKVYNKKQQEIFKIIKILSCNNKYNKTINQFKKKSNKNKINIKTKYRLNKIIIK